MGALTVALSGWAVGGEIPLMLIGGTIGFGGMLLDSLLGAWIQGRYICRTCGMASERRVHRCGLRTEWLGGWQWLDNDGVNALSTGCAALAGVLLCQCLS